MKLRHLPFFALLGATAVHAADAGFTSEGDFIAAAGATSFESFEQLPTGPRAVSAITTPLFTISTATTPIGVLQTGVNSPVDGFGSAATDGIHYVSAYLPNVSQGTLTFTLAAPSKAFGLYLTDIGETDGQIILRTNAGAFSSDLIAGTHPPLLPNGYVRFVGFTQDQAFTQVTLTVTGVDDAYGLDKVYVSAVPEPASALLMGLGLASLLASRRKR